MRIVRGVSVEGLTLVHVLYCTHKKKTLVGGCVAGATVSEGVAAMAVPKVCRVQV